MDKLIQFFTPNIEMSFFEKQKTKAFIILGLIGLILTGVTAIQSIVARNENFIVSLLSGVALGAFVLISLFVLRAKGHSRQFKVK
jgi:hypothetical protein